MSHFSEHDWLEFSRGKVAPKRHGAMQRHLDLDCKSCQKTLDQFRRAGFLVAQSKFFRDPPYFLRCSLPFME
jgi:hypothetical protein